MSPIEVPEPEVVVQIGGMHAAAEPTWVTTVLGSCIAACLFDPQVGVGGMNHFMLPDADEEDPDRPGRFGLHAMELLIGAMQRLGASRRRMRAKVFGGGHVLEGPEHEDSVPRRNVAFIRRFLEEEAIPLVASDLGGYLPREVRLHTASGRCLVRKLGNRALRVARLEEQRARRTSVPERPSGQVWLFEGQDAA